MLRPRLHLRLLAHQRAHPSPPGKIIQPNVDSMEGGCALEHSYRDDGLPGNRPVKSWHSPKKSISLGGVGPG